MFKNLNNLAIATQRTRVMQCSPDDLQYLKTAFIESLSEPEQKFYSPRMTHPRLPTMFIVFAHARIIEQEGAR